MDLQPYSHDRFSKIMRTLFDFRNNTYWVSLFQRNNSIIFQTGVSCFSIILFYSTLLWTGVSCFSVILFYSTLLALSHRQKDRQRNKYTCYTWAGGTFFQLCCCLQNNPPENNVEPVPAKRTAGYLRFGGNWHYIIFQRIVLGSIFFRLKFFFCSRFRYKLMYYNLYHVSDLCKIVRFLCEIECIKFEWNKFVLVLVKNDLIHIEHSNCISSTYTKTNTNSLHSRSIHSISRKIRHVIQIVVHQFVRKTMSTFKLYQFNLNLK